MSFKLTFTRTDVDPPFQGVYRVAKADMAVGGVSVQKGQRVFLDIGTANAAVRPPYFLQLL